VPGGDGFVCVDSDEHDEEGHITEDRLMRKLMVEKRNKKLEKFKTNDMIRPSFFGPESYEILLISWGSTKNMVLEALDRVQDKRIAYLHLPLVYPLPETLGEYLDKARKTIIIENNYTAQLARLIRMEMGFEIKEKILKYDGHPFSVEAIEQELRLRI
jgi:2-oxoglutarate ferredoxin oxidoreductase subunit alpha